jgi:selenocysteine-specific elongation factor
VVVVAGDRFVLRQPSPSLTLGGGEVLSPQPRRRWRRFDPAVLARLATLAHGQPDEVLLHTLDRLRLTTPSQLIARAELDAAVASAALDDLCRQHALVEIRAGDDVLLIGLAAWQRIVEGLSARVADYHRHFPLRRGLPRGEARARLQPLLPGVDLTVRIFNAVLEELGRRGHLHADDAGVRLPDFTPTPTPVQQAHIDRLLAAFGAAPYAPPNQQDARQLLGDDAGLLEFLIEQGVLVRLGGDVLLRGVDFATMVDGIIAQLHTHGAVTLAEVRDLFQTSRKYAQAVLEEMDARRITRREGEARVLR